MKNLLLISLAAAVYFMFFSGNVALSDMPPVIADATSVREKNYEGNDLYDSRTSLKDLAEIGSYTIVEIYTDICVVCKALEAKFPALLSQREDFVIRRVRLEAGSFSFSSTVAAEAEAEAKKWMAREDAMQEFFNYYGTPHIEIFDDKGNAIAVDDGSDKTGFNTLKTWLNWRV